MMQLLFSARGRINRARFWGASILFGLCLALACGIVGFGIVLVAPPSVATNGEFNVSNAAAIPLGILYVGYFALSLWVGVCLGVKRYHDLDKAGAWVLIVFVPVVGGIIYLVQVGCLRGTSGPNRFGPDPLREFA